MFTQPALLILKTICRSWQKTSNLLRSVRGIILPLSTATEAREGRRSNSIRSALRRGKASATSGTHETPSSAWFKPHTVYSWRPPRRRAQETLQSCFRRHERRQLWPMVRRSAA